jgi:hypothetical protein
VERNETTALIATEKSERARRLIPRIASAASLASLQRTESRDDQEEHPSGRSTVRERPAGDLKALRRPLLRGINLRKAARIEELLAWLQVQLGDELVITDHWKADLTAIGVSATDDPSQLAHLWVHGLPVGRYRIELEFADPAQPDPGHREFGELLNIRARHLQHRR